MSEWDAIRMYELSKLAADDEKVLSLSKSNQTILIAWRRGFRSNHKGEVYSPSEKLVKTHPIGVAAPDGSHYLKFSIGVPKNLSVSYGFAVKVHRFVAYQRFGDLIMKPGVQVRHFPDARRSNNKHCNILIGTRSDNMMDRTKFDRTRIARMGGEANAKKLSKLSPKESIAVAFAAARGATNEDLARKYSVSRFVIYRAVSKFKLATVSQPQMEFAF